MSKCEWKGNVFYPCDNFDPVANHVGNHHYVAHCQGCQTDLDKPEPEIIIKKSGDTWVYKYDSIDYFVTDPAEAKSEHCLLTLIKNCGHDIRCAKPISEIEITDEIAKLWPMVHVELNGIETLYGIFGNYALTENGLHSMENLVIELATVADLEKS